MENLNWAANRLNLGSPRSADEETAQFFFPRLPMALSHITDKSLRFCNPRPANSRFRARSRPRELTTSYRAASVGRRRWPLTVLPNRTPQSLRWRKPLTVSFGSLHEIGVFSTSATAGYLPQEKENPAARLRACSRSRTVSCGSGLKKVSSTGTARNSHKEAFRLLSVTSRSLR